MGFLFFVLVAGFIIYKWMKNAKASQQQWQAAAERLGLGYYPGDIGMIGRIHGLKGGHRIEIATFVKGGGKSSKTYTKYRVNYHERIPVDFKLTRQKALHRLGQVFGMEDIELGNPEFDDRVVVRGMHPEMVREFLSTDRQIAVLRLINAYNDVVITNEFIEVIKLGKDANVAAIVHTARAALSVCNDLTDTSPSVAEEQRIIESEEPEPLSGFRPEEVYIIDPVEPSFDPYTPPNPIVPDPTEFFDIEEPVAELEQSGPEIVEGEPIEDAERVAEPASEEEGAESFVAMDLEQIAKELFSGDAGNSLVISKTFDARFKGKTVSGVGVLSRVSKFNYDMIFTNATGVKATVEICEFAGPYSKIKVTAEVKYPTETYDALKSQVGQSLPVSGKLVAQDAMMHQLYVADD